MLRLLPTLSPAIAMFVLAATADAAPFDHLQCFKIKDSSAKAIYTADLDSNDPAFDSLTPGCSITVPAKLLCVDVSKDNVNPAPPGAPDGVPLQKFLCYKTRCPKFQPAATLTDQFGVHSVQVKATGLLCAPVASPLVSTTSTTQPCVDADMDSYCSNVDCDDGDPAINPAATESCNNQDDNCNGQADEGNPGGGAACSTGMPGVCSAGTTTCAGSLQCIQNQGPSAEICDSLDNDCDGFVDEGNVCLLPDGTACSSNSQCSSFQCVDGVCCNSACASTCQACSAAKTGGFDGQCSFIPMGADPDAECVGTSVCNGSGGCTP
ncbi:MAG TPA: putative metal-binding motif-containing protein [Candidatus Limnocylindrales bacterium]|nr:putative metal-binding motif-containing protein [Candidatus Limnocylindrales bacterium]